MTTREVARNIVRNYLDLTFLRDEAIADPSVYGTAVSTACDFACPHCQREALGVRENALMDFDKLEPHKEEMRAARRVSLFGLGEPFLNPRFFDFLEMCTNMGVESATTCHGMSLKPEVREKLIELHLDELTISMDGATKKLFEKLRVNGNFDEVTGNIRAMADLKKERGVDFPVINVNMTVMRENVHQIPVMVRLANKMGAQSVSFSSVVIYKTVDLHKNVADSAEFEKYMEQGRRLASRLGMPFSFWRQKPIGWQPEPYNPEGQFGCSQLWANQIIEPDGRMKVCCYIEEDIANVFELGPRAAFNCDTLRRERRKLMRGAVRVECQGCVYLRERNPSWVQSQINEALKFVFDFPDFTDEDRKDLLEQIAEFQAEKDALYPNHRHRPVAKVEGEPEAVHASADADLPIY